MRLIILTYIITFLPTKAIKNIKNEGVIFQNLGKVNFITASHNLVITLDIENFENSIKELIKIMEANKDIINAETHYLSWHYFYLLNNVISQIKIKYHMFQRYIQTFNNLSFQKKMSYDNNEKFLNDIIDTVDNNDDSDEVTIINSYVSKVNIAKKNIMTDIDKAIYRSNLTLTALNLHLYDNSSFLFNVPREIVLSQSINFCELSLRDFNEEIKQLLYKLDSILATSKTSILVITPEKFKKVLEKLQNNVTLLYPPTQQFIPEYYTISKTIVKKKDNKLYFIIQIPIKSTYEYNLYKLHFLWIPLRNLQSWSRKINVENNYLAISEDGGQYSLFDKLDFCVFLKSSMICIPTREIKFSSRIYPDENCLLSLYNDEIHNNCVFTYERDRKTEFIKVNSFWIGSILDDDEYIIQNCNSNDRKKINMPKGIVTLSISNNHCTYSGNKFLLPNFEISSDNDKKPTQLEIVIEPIVVQFSSLIVSSLFLSNLKHITTHDITFFQAIVNNNDDKYSNAIINSKTNFGLLIFICISFIVVGILLLIYFSKTLGETQKQKKLLPTIIHHPLLLPPPLPPVPPPPPPPQFISDDDDDDSNNSSNKLNHTYEDCSYINMDKR